MVLDRTATHLRQVARKTGKEDRLGFVLDCLMAMLPHLGERSHSRVMQNRIGELLFKEQVRVIAPSCPDYSHENGLYTFASVGDNIPLLAVQHHRLLLELQQHVPNLQCTILIADQEGDDTAIQQKVGLDRSAFQAKIASSVEVTRRAFQPVGIAVEAMSTRFPTLSTLRAEYAESFRTNKLQKTRFITDTQARFAMYRKLGITDLEVMLERTIQTAADYAALATLAQAAGLLVCNHETVNLSWYTDYGAALLHNPVRLY